MAKKLTGIPEHSELVNQTTINLIKKPILIKEAMGNVIACNPSYLDFRKTGTIDLLGHGAYDLLSKIQFNFYTLAEEYLLINGLDSFEYEGYQEATQFKVLLQRIQFSDKKVNAIQLTITHQATLSIIDDRKICLTVRETSILQLLMEGNSQKQIAISLCLSHHTIASYLKIIYVKLRVKSCSQALLVATTNLNMRARAPFKPPLEASPDKVCWQKKSFSN